MLSYGDLPVEVSGREYLRIPGRFDRRAAARTAIVEKVLG
jgi:hypothetical protein